MPSCRTALAVLAAAGALALPALALAQQDDAAPKAPDPSAVFRTALLDDAKTTSVVKDLLTSKAGTVDSVPLFGDLTGDGRADAVVRVLTGGTAGAIAVYVLSTDGLAEDAPLRVVYRNQQLNRVVARVSGASLLLTVPTWKRGDDTVRASAYEERTYTWSKTARTFRRTAKRSVDAPISATPSAARR